MYSLSSSFFSSPLLSSPHPSSLLLAPISISPPPRLSDSFLNCCRKACGAGVRTLDAITAQQKQGVFRCLFLARL